MQYEQREKRAAKRAADQVSFHRMIKHKPFSLPLKIALRS